MDAQKIQERINSILADQFNIKTKEITPETRFREDLGSDSLDQVEIILEVEEEFNVIIQDEEAEAITTVAQLYDKVESLVGTK